MPVQLPDHVGNRSTMYRAKASLHPLPVVPGGIGEVRVWSFHAVVEAAREYSAENDIKSIRDKAKVESAVIWIAYRCSDLSTHAIGLETHRKGGSLHRAIRMFDAELHLGRRREIVDGILSIMVRKGHATPAAKRVAPETVIQRVEKARETQPCEIDPDAELIRKWRDRGCSVKRISKFTEIPEDRVAKVLGVQWGRVDT